jgi:hypothetical protein
MTSTGVISQRIGQDLNSEQEIRWEDGIDDGVLC